MPVAHGRDRPSSGSRIPVGFMEAVSDTTKISGEPAKARSQTSPAALSSPESDVDSKCSAVVATSLRLRHEQRVSSVRSVILASVTLGPGSLEPDDGMLPEDKLVRES